MLDLTKVNYWVGLIHMIHNPFIVQLMVTKISQPLATAILHCGC